MLVFSFSIICTNLLFGSRFVVFLTNPIYFYFLADKIRSESMFFHSEFVVSSFCFSFTKLILHHFYAICELLCHLLQFSYFFSNHIFIYNVCISIHRNTDIRVPHDILSKFHIHATLFGAIMPWIFSFIGCSPASLLFPKKEQPLRKHFAS